MLQNESLSSTAAIIMMLVAMATGPALADVDCSVLDPRASVSTEKEGKITASVDALFKAAKAGGSVEGRLRNEINNLQKGVPVTEMALIQLRTLYLFCGMVANAKDISTDRKVELFNSMMKAKDDTPKHAEPKTKPAPSTPKKQVATTRGQGATQGHDAPIASQRAPQSVPHGPASGVDEKRKEVTVPPSTKPDETSPSPAPAEVVPPFLPPTKAPFIPGDYAGNSFKVGQEYYTARNYTEAVTWYRKAAEKGHRDAQYRLGFMYANGQGVPKSDDWAVTWYRKAAEMGHPAAQDELKKRGLGW